jgi:hypothetical protein
MGKYLLIIVSLLILAHNARSEVIAQKKIHCFPLEQTSKELKDAGEMPTFIAENDLTGKQSTILMTYNKETGTWTILEIINNLACVVGFGKQTNL